MRIWVLLVGLWPALALAEVYRWTDAQGQVHFGERPPAGAQRLEVRPQVMERDVHTRQREAAAERFFEARRDEQAQREQAARQRRLARAQQCQALRDRLAYLSQGGRYYSTDAKGERAYHSDGQMEAARQALLEDIGQACR